MSSSDPLKSTPLKSKKSLNLSSESPISKTPEKHAFQLPNRACNRGVALSIKEIQPVTQTWLKPATDQIKSPPKQILSVAIESPPPKASGDRPDKLPEKYEILCNFFYSLDSAIRLLKLKGSMPTFTNISPKIECLTDRRFSYGHLAQLKYILPEAIEIKRMLIFDERTSCMKPDLHVSIIVDAIDCEDESKSDTKNLNLRRVFRARLADYLKAYPEGDEVPAEDLPEPFNRSKQNIQLNMIKGGFPWSSDQSSTDTLREQQSLTAQGEVIQEEARSQPFNRSNSYSKLAVKTLAAAFNDQQPELASHVSRSFRKRFSQKATSKAPEAVQKCSKVSLQSLIFQVPELCADKSAFSDKTTSSPIKSPTKSLSRPTTIKPSPKSCLPATPVKEINPLKTEDESPTKAGSIQSTPAKLASTPARLMTATPNIKPQKRCYISPDDVSSSSSNKLVRRPLRTRSLKFDNPVKEEKVVDEVHEMAGKPVDSDEDDILSMLPESPLHSIMGKERKATDEQDPAISQAKRQRHLIARLPKLFNMIHYLFQSINRSIITKEELIYKIIADHCDIANREVEEQLKLLLELAPEWISEKMAFTGDLLLCINKVSSPESIRMQVQEAK
ncbi:CDT1-like protein b isoform X2 [Durio zibethinus]|uniref:CDT1-like protein b isoform X2 n=1 Tax=Durio zibethinus TaxID=66656 RepID=A0A6P5XK09_DURZI|nr:CDT1-like protein b isoform X2 [Durio zibethinus]